MDYFAYGSNLDAGQISRRCPSAAFRCRALLVDHALVFPRRSTNWGGGAASIAPAPGGTVWGVVYRLSEADGRALDGWEGFDPARPPAVNRYDRQEVDVLAEDQAGAPLHAWTYVARPESGSFRPTAAYLAAIVRGARHWGLPADYIAALEAIATR